MKIRYLFFLSIIFTTLSIQADMVAIRGTFFDFVEDPWDYPEDESKAARYMPDGLLVIEDGIIKAFGPYKQLKGNYPNVKVTEYKDRIIIPGMIDCHIHYPQTAVVASYGAHLLDWLNEYIWPEELKFKDINYARSIAKQFFDIVLKNGTTTVQSFTTTAPESVTAFFDEAQKRNLRVISGLSGLNRKGIAPDDYLDTAQSFYDNSKMFIKKYHNKGRSLYAITPRFALGSTPEQLKMCQKLKKEYPDCWVLTHIAETPRSTRETLTDFPEAKDFLEIYENYDLVGPKFSGGHGVYLSENEFDRLSEKGGAIDFCPCSNLFLGSGLFQLGLSKRPNKKILVGLGTDMGGGDTFSLFRVMNEGYKVGMLNNLRLMGSFNLQREDIAGADRNRLSAYRALYLATLGGARSLYVTEWIGNFDVGKEADFVVLNPVKGSLALPIRQKKYQTANPTKDDIAGQIFGLISLGDERTVEATYIMGKAAHLATNSDM